MGKLRPFVRKDSYMPNKKWIPFVIGNGYTTTDGASGPAPEYETVTGNPVSFNAITPFPLRQLSVAFSPVQSGSGDPSPDNVRPILGWDSLTVYHSGADTSDPQTISITIGQTVYSGVLDVLTGVVTVDWVSRRITSMNRNNGHFFYIGSGSWQHRPLAKLTTTGGLLCDRRPTIAQPSSGSTAIDGCYTDSSRAFNVRTLESYSTASEMITAMGGEVNICYKTDPFTIQLTPQEVNSLAGDNTMWTDGDSLEVNYRSN